MEILVIIALALAVVAATLYFSRKNVSLQISLKDEAMERSERMWQEKLADAETQASAEKSRLESALASEKNSCEERLASMKESHEAMTAALKESYESRLTAADRNLIELRKSYDTMIAEMKANQEKALASQVEAMKSEMTARTEEVLKARESELDKKAEETFKSITGSLAKDLDEMKKSFNENRQTQTESSASLKEHLENAVKNLKEQTAAIGAKADHLADALRGRNKMQGCFGETILENILVAEGFREGVDYDREATLRDDTGLVIPNEDSGKRMRPDVIIHFPDKTDVIVDSKVDLKALSDWNEASDEATKADAAQRNLKAIREQVANLSRKDYSSYISGDKKSLGYVVMFVPIYASLQLAKSIDPNIWRDAFNQNVLITTEETLVPFLRMIRTAWRNVEQVRNQQNIIKAAEEMISRVSDMAAGYAKIGKKLDDLHKEYESCEKKLRGSGRSIIVSARNVISYGVKPRAGKELPMVSGTEDFTEEPAPVEEGAADSAE